MNAFRATLATVLVGVASWSISASAVRGQAESPALSPEVAKLHVELRDASRAYAAQDYEGAMTKVAAVQQALDAIVQDPPADAAKQLEPIYVVLERAHGLLRQQGKPLPPLNKPNLALLSRMSESVPDASSVPFPTTTPVPEPTPPMATGTVSFVEDVVPILTQRCGGCHVAKASGRFSMKDYETLMKGHPVNGIVVAPGNPPGSVLLEMIQDKQMPPSGDGIPEQEYQTLVTWVAEGAQFDGKDPKASLARLSNNPSTAMTPEPEEPMIALPTGNESVSFARHIAPVLVENCSGCHFRPTQQARGGLNFTMFAGLVEGGDTGPPLSTATPAMSLLVMKLRGMGDGQQMPVGRPPLSDEQIAVIEKWIAEGARFDGPDPEAPLDQVAALAIAEASTPEQLTEIRRGNADEKWRLALGGVPPEKVETEQFMFYGNVGQNTLQELADGAEAVTKDVREALNSPASAPLGKGKFALFVTGQRYDLGEFASMVDSRRAPGDRFGYARYTIIDAYGVVLPSRDGGFSNDALLAEQIAALHVASQGKDIPEWFYGGAGQMAAAALYPDDPRILGWTEQLAQAVQQMQAPDDFLTGRMPPETAQVVSWSFVDYLARDRRKFGALMNSLRDGQPFTPSFTRAFGGSPQQVAVLWAQNGVKPR